MRLDLGRSDVVSLISHAPVTPTSCSALWISASPSLSRGPSRLAVEDRRLPGAVTAGIRRPLLFSAHSGVLAEQFERVRLMLVLDLIAGASMVLMSANVLLLRRASPLNSRLGGDFR